MKINIFKGWLLDRKMKERVQINFALSNKVSYTLMTFLVLIILGVGIYAVVPNPGHSISDLEFPTCAEGELLGINSIGDWDCITPTQSSPGLWTESGSDISFTGGNVGIGTANPSNPLEVCKDNACFRLVPTVGNYGGDVYGDWKGKTNLCTGNLDTCNGDTLNAYSCGVNEIRTCKDMKIYSGSTFNCGGYMGGTGQIRTITCNKETRLNPSYTDGLISP